MLKRHTPFVYGHCCTRNGRAYYFFYLRNTRKRQKVDRPPSMCIDRLSPPPPLLNFILQKQHVFLLVLSIAHVHRSFLVVSGKMVWPIGEREEGWRRKETGGKKRKRQIGVFSLLSTFVACMKIFSKHSCVLLKNIFCYCYFLSRYQAIRVMLAAHSIRTLGRSLCCNYKVHVRLQGSSIDCFSCPVASLSITLLGWGPRNQPTVNRPLKTKK